MTPVLRSWRIPDSRPARGAYRLNPAADPRLRSILAMGILELTAENPPSDQITCVGAGIEEHCREKLRDTFSITDQSDVQAFITFQQLAPLGTVWASMNCLEPGATDDVEHRQAFATALGIRKGLDPQYMWDMCQRTAQLLQSPPPGLPPMTSDAGAIDAANAVAVVRLARTAGLISESEAHDFLLHIGADFSGRFGSWRRFVDGWITGAAVLSDDPSHTISLARSFATSLLASPASPWRTLPTP